MGVMTKKRQCLVLYVTEIMEVVLHMVMMMIVISGACGILDCFKCDVEIQLMVLK